MDKKDLFLKYNLHRKKENIHLARKGSKPFAVLLHATYECNANCAYCENKHLKHNFKNPVISKEDITQLLEKLGPDIRLLILHGGEPLLLRKSLLAHLTREIKRLDLKIRVSLQTNGILMDNKMRRFLKAHDIHWGTSFNGLHNTETRGEKSTEALLKIIEDYHPSFISVYDDTTYKNLIPNYEYYKKLGVRSFQSSIMRDIKGENESPEINNNLQLLFDYIDYWIHDTNNPISDRWIIRQIERVLGNAHLCEDVDCIGGWLVVDPDGNLCHCGYDNENKSHIYCNIKDINNSQDLLDNINYQEFCAKQNALIVSECNDCEWLHVCNGSCMKCHFNYDKTFKHLNPTLCEFNKTILDYISNLIMDIDIQDKEKYNPYFIKVLKDNEYISLTKILEKEGMNE